MRVGIIQPNYIPWRGYFDFIASVDVFILLDDVQYTSRDWRNRNRLKTANGLKWITVPVRHDSREQLVCESWIDESRDWRENHIKQFEFNYVHAPCFKVALELFKNCLTMHNCTISVLNEHATRLISRFMGIDTPVYNASIYAVTGQKSSRLIELIKRVNGDVYLSGPSADDYLDKEAFRRAGIRLEYKSYDYMPYPQLWGEFDGRVTILDLIANCGTEARNYIRSHSPDHIIIP